MPSDPCWQVDNITLKVIWTTSNSKLAELVEISAEISAEITHASNPNHVTAHAEWIEKRLRSKIHNGNDLWNHKDSLFPSLTFCNTVHRQIRRLNGQIFDNVWEKLSDLQAHGEGWTSGGFNTEGLLGNPRPESTATLQMLGQGRDFPVQMGEERIFSWHISLTDSWRLYFFPGPELGKMIIGYIGPHLPTIQHR